MTPTLSSSPKTNLSVLAYNKVKSDIINGQLKPGDKLLMSQLVENYLIGTGPMREALSQLVADKLVTAVSQKGFRVALMSVEELQDIYEARAHLEAMLVGLAVEKADQQWEANIVAAAYTLNKIDEVKTTEAILTIWDTHHKAFHNAIVNGCGSTKLLELRTTLFDQAERYRQLWLKETVFSDTALTEKKQEHQQLVEVLLQRKKANACNLIYHHLLSPIPIITDILLAKE